MQSDAERYNLLQSRLERIIEASRGEGLPGEYPDRHPYLEVIVKDTCGYYLTTYMSDALSRLGEGLY